MYTRTLKAGLRSVWSVVACVLASSGLRTDRIGLQTVLTVGVLSVGYAGHALLVNWDPNGPAHATRVYVYFGALFVIRYMYLFSSFVPNGIADRLIGRFGEKRGYALYELGTSWMFFQRGLTFAPLIALQPWSLLDWADVESDHRATARALCVIAGATLAIGGFVVNTASTLVVGFDVYYYKDLFLRRPVGAFEARGPYRYFSNPMYGIGQCSGYGAALMVGSLEGLLATLLNQILMYVFYYRIEKPHIKAIFGNTVVEPDAGPALQLMK